MDDRGRLIVITGPSGVGKSTIVAEALRRTGATFSVSVTTRQPRPGEANGAEYRFVDRETFREMADAGQLLEWAEVYGERYGTPADAVREAIDAGRTVLLEIDLQGGLRVHERVPETTLVYILPPSEEELSRRLADRGSEDAASHARRSREAKKEIDAARRSGVYNHWIVNDDLDSAIDQVVRIIQSGARA